MYVSLPSSDLLQPHGRCYLKSRSSTAPWIPLSRIWSRCFHLLQETEYTLDHDIPVYKLALCNEESTPHVMEHLPGLWWILAFEPHFDCTLLKSIFLWTIWTCKAREEKQCRFQIMDNRWRRYSINKLQDAQTALLYLTVFNSFCTPAFLWPWWWRHKSISE